MQGTPAMNPATTSLPNGSEDFFKAVEHRRTYYNVTKALPSNLNDAKLLSIVQRAIQFAPNPFNMQESRAVIVTGAKHEQLWDMVKETYGRTLGGDQEAIAAANKKVDEEYKAGYGTILFFEDMGLVKGWAERLPSIGQHFYAWAKNAAGMVQYITWTALEAEGLGLSLQHHGAYSPETHAGILKLVEAPETWKSSAMMPFGVPSGPPGAAGRPKTFGPVEGRVKAFFG